MKLPFYLLLSGLTLCAPASALDLKTLAKAAADIPKPTASLDKFDIKQITLRDITFTFTVAISNPYPVELKLDAVEIDFSVEGKKTLQTTAAKGFAVKAKKKALTSFDVTMTYEAIMLLVQNYSTNDFLNCQTAVQIKIPIPKVIKGLPPTVDFSFKLNKKIPAIKPKVSIAAFAVKLPTEAEVKESLMKSASASAKSLDAKKVQSMFSSLLAGKTVDKKLITPEELDLKFKVSFDIILQNETKAALDFNALDFIFTVNSNELVKGQTAQIKKTGTLSTLHVENEFSSKNLTASILDAFKSGKGTFTLTGITTLSLPPEILDHPLKLDFTENGDFKLR